MIKYINKIIIKGGDVKTNDIEGNWEGQAHRPKKIFVVNTTLVWGSSHPTVMKKQFVVMIK